MVGLQRAAAERPGRPARRLHKGRRGGPHQETRALGLARPRPRAPRTLRRHITLSDARSRLYRRRSLQVNRHFSAFFKIYKIFTILRRSNLKILQNSAKFRQTFRDFEENSNFH